MFKTLLILNFFLIGIHYSSIHAQIPEFSFQLGQPSIPDSPEYLFSPVGNAVLNNGNIVVVDSRPDFVQIFTPEGALVTSFGPEGTGEGKFMNPLGVTVNHENQIIIGDARNNNIQPWLRQDINAFHKYHLGWLNAENVILSNDVV